MIDAQHPLLLASASPRRRELLVRVGVPVEVRAVDVDEAVHASEDAASYLDRVVAAKLRAAAELLQNGAAQELGRCAALLVADTSVIHAGEVLGKPIDDGDARRMLSCLAGDVHEVCTRVAIAGATAPDVALWQQTVTSRVFFRPLDEAQLRRYVATAEGRDKAGAYGIQGVGSMLVRRIEGSYANVVGLPICAVVEALQDLGLLGACPVVGQGDGQGQGDSECVG